ncbi:uncharacterized protein VTP21DRAFT_259 [Calcarisporiella thermophila]|uniref:uncharacterized protein n=1 Tax=Calcarisporiella thermophila TaxID=911321 RepID=UPI0037449D6E
MASTVTILLARGQRQVVKTTPNMILKQIVTTVCKQQGYADPDAFGLKYNRNVLDLSLSVRFANLPAGAKLELINIAKSNTVSDITIALQLEEGGRLVDKFSPNASLWNILLHFEKQSNGALNLTRREAQHPKNPNSLKKIADKFKNKEAPASYLQPVCVVLNKEFGSIQSLKTTTLQSIGLTSGSVAIRLWFRLIDETLSAMLPEIEAPIPTSTNSTSTASSKTQNDAPQPGPVPRISEPAPSHASQSRTPPPPQPGPIPVLPQASASHAPQQVQQPAPPSGTSEKATAPLPQTSPPQSQTSFSPASLQDPSPPAPQPEQRPSAAPITPGPTSAMPITLAPVAAPSTQIDVTPSHSQPATSPAHSQVPPISPTQTQEGQTTKAPQPQPGPQQVTLVPTKTSSTHPTPTPAAVPSITMEVDPSSTSIPSPKLNEPQNVEGSGIDRDIKVYRPPADTGVPLSNRIDLPDSFYELTPAELRNILAIQKARHIQEERQGFKTRAVREMEEKAKMNKYPKTAIRVRFPDRIQLQATFLSKEPVKNIYEFVKSALCNPNRAFTLYTAPPMRHLSDESISLYHANLAPASVVYFSWKENAPEEESYLNTSYLSRLEDLPVPAVNEVSMAMAVDNVEKRDEEAVNRQRKEEAAEEEDRRRRLARTEQSQTRPSSSGPKMPKWFKMGKK